MMLRTTTLLLVWCLLSVGCAAGVAGEADLATIEKEFGPPAMHVPAPAAPPVIDGKLDDAAWKQAKPVALRFLTGRWEEPTEKTEARVLADETCIYFAVRCHESQPDKIIAAGNGRDGDLWGGDTVEVFLDPGHGQRRERYYHVIINPKGLIYDGRGKDAKAWNAKISAKAGKFAGGWTVEVAVPMSDLGVAGEIPTVWGLNINRQRPELGEVAPVRGITSTAVRLKEPEKYREGEDTAWSPTYCRSSHMCQRFGHAVLAVGTKDVEPPQQLFELIYKSDFDDGKAAGWTGVKAVDENFRGPGKCITPKDGSGAIHFGRPLRNLDDVTLILCAKMPRDGRLYYYGRAPDGEQCEADRHEIFMTGEAADARSFPHLHDYDTHGSMMAWKSHGRRRKAPGPWAMMTGHFSEPSIGSVMSPGTDWVILRTRLGMMRRQRSQGLVPASQNYPRGLTFASGNPYLIDQVVVFRGMDLQPPQRVGGIQLKRDGDAVIVSWSRAADNTITAYYAVYADGEPVAETHQLSARLPGGKVKGKAITIRAFDLYGNASDHSKPHPVQ